MEDYEIKARALVMSFLLVVGKMEIAKQCAKISVKEILQAGSVDIVNQYFDDRYLNKVNEAIDVI